MAHVVSLEDRLLLQSILQGSVRVDVQEMFNPIVQKKLRS